MSHSDSVALVTGGTSGVGLSIVRALAEQGTFVHFIGTNTARGAALEAELNAQGSGGRFVALDLSNLHAVRAFARGFREEVPKLDLLANVAGVLLAERRETSEGLEMTFAIDYLSAVVLIQELTPALENSSGGRVLNVSGLPAAILKQRLDFENMDNRRGYNGVRVAFDAVHAKTVVTEILAEQLEDRGIDVNAFHPGRVKSNLGQGLGPVLKALLGFLGRFMSTRSTSGDYLATSPDVAGVTGQLFVKEKPRPLSFDATYKAALWDWTTRTIEGVLGSQDH